MQVRVYRDETLIGTAMMEGLDPSMGVAYGPFSPAGQYDREQHANVIEGDYIGDRGQALSVYADQHGRLVAVKIAILDWADPDVGKELELLFQDSCEFTAVFSTHSLYRA
jgi:hypothetical protein